MGRNMVRKNKDNRFSCSKLPRGDGCGREERNCEVTENHLGYLLTV